MSVRQHHNFGLESILIDAGSYYEGQCLKAGAVANSGYGQVATAKGDEIFGIVDRTEYNEGTKTAKTFAAGQSINMWKLGCHRQVRVRAATGLTINPNDTIYYNGTYATNVDPTTARKIGTAPRNHGTQTTTADGDLIWVDLDIEPGAATS